MTARCFRFFGLAGTLSFLAAGCSNEAGDDPAPDFTLKAVDGRVISLSDYRGKVVLINFWAVGCMPCRMEMVHIRNVYEHYEGRLVILAVNAWDEPREVVKSFADKQELPFLVLLNGRKVHTESYKGKAVPMGVLVDGQGRIVLQQIGFDKQRIEQLDKKLKQLLS